MRPASRATRLLPVVLLPVLLLAVLLRRPPQPPTRRWSAAGPRRAAS
jgi:hypothetical protein